MDNYSPLIQLAYILDFGCRLNIVGLKIVFLIRIFGSVSDFFVFKAHECLSDFGKYIYPYAAEYGLSYSYSHMIVDPFAFLFMTSLSKHIFS